MEKYYLNIDLLKIIYYTITIEYGIVIRENAAQAINPNKYHSNRQNFSFKSINSKLWKLDAISHTIMYIYINNFKLFN